MKKVKPKPKTPGATRSKLKHAVDVVLVRAITLHADACQNSCDRPGHFKECVQERIENDRAVAALSVL